MAASLLVLVPASVGPARATTPALAASASGTPQDAAPFGSVPGGFSPLGGQDVADVRLGAGGTATVQVAGQGGVPGSGAGAVALAARVSGASGPGSVSVYPAGGDVPVVPGLSWEWPGGASGLVVSALSAGGQVTVRNDSSRPVLLSLAADGYWLAGTVAAAGTFSPLGGQRVADVRLGAGGLATVQVAGRAGIPGSGTGAVALTVAVTGAGLPGSVSVYPEGGNTPAVPGLSWGLLSAGASGLVVSGLSASGRVTVRNDSSGPASLRIAADGYLLSASRTVTNIEPKPTTVTLGAQSITAVSGDPASTLSVTLASGVQVPAVGQAVVAAPSSAVPAGLLGTVTGVSGGPSGTSILTLAPATLDQAYSTFDVATSQTLANSDVQISGGKGGTSAGQAMSASAVPMTGTRSAAAGSTTPQPAVLAAAPKFGFDLSDAAFTCEGSGGGPTISLTADLSKINVDLALNADPAAPSFYFLATADPVFTINIGFTGKLDCKLSDDKFLTARIPVPGAPGLEVDLSPVVELTAGGQASVDFQWAPRAELGFVKAPGVSLMTHGFGSSGSVGISAIADADLFLGLDAEVTLAGRVGVGGDFGPDLSASYDLGTGCLTVDGELKADLTASANVFVKDWSFAIATGIFDKSQLYSKCIPPPLTVTADLPAAAVGQPYTGTVTASGGTGTSSFALTSGSLPTGLSLAPDGTITGTPDSAGSSTFTITATDSAGHTASGTYTIIVASSGGNGGGGNGGGGSLQSLSGLPLPANAAAQETAQVDTASCGPSVCAAAGSYTDTAGAMHEALWLWSGGSWAVTEAPLPADSAPGNVYAVYSSCGSDACVVSGQYASTASAGSTAVLWTWSGGSWNAASTPVPSGAGTTPPSVQALSCGTSLCAAVGYVNNTSGVEQPALWVLSGGAWTVTRPALPADAVGGQDAESYAVSCGSSVCAAVGEYNVDSTIEWTAWSWSGGSWAAPALVPSDAGAAPGLRIQSASCWTDTCLIYEAYTDTSNNNRTVVWQDLSGSWNPADLLLPADAQPGSQLIVDGAPCGWGECLVSASYFDASYNTHKAWWVWTGSAWTTITVPAADDIGFDMVSCGSGVCAAESVSQGTLWTWTSGSTSVSSQPAPNADTLAYSPPLSCGAGQCAVASSHADTSGASQNAILIWSGGSWTTADLSAPPGSWGFVIDGLTCGAGQCLAGASYANSGSEQNQWWSLPGGN